MMVALALGAALVGSASGNVNVAVHRHLGEMLAGVEGAARDLATADAITCVTSEPCKSNNCLSIAALATGVCKDLVYNFSSVAATDASDNKCLGMAALMLDAPMSAADDTAVCTAFNMTNWTNTCVRNVPFKAFLSTMERHINDTCEVFVSDTFGLLGISQLASGRRMLDGNASHATPTDAQKAVMHAAGAAVMGASATAAMNALGLSWSMIIAPILGMQGEDIRVAIQNKAFSCLTVTHFGISNYSAASAESKALAIAILTDKMTNNGAFYTVEQIMANLTAITESAAVTSWAGSLPANFIAGWNSTLQGWNASDSSTDVTVSPAALSIPVISALVSAMATAAGQGLQNIAVDETVFAAQVGAIALALSNSTAWSTTESATARGVLQYSIGAVFVNKSFSVTAGNSTEVQGLVDNQCSLADFNADPECVAASLPVVWTFFQTLWRTSNWIASTMEPTSVRAAITAIIMSTVDVRMVMAIESTMGPCFSAPYDALMPLLAMFGRLASGTNDARDTQVATGLALGTGCGLARAGKTEGADPAMANMQSCYLLAIAQKNPAILMAAKTKTFTQEHIFGMKDSMGNVQTRCNDVDYPLGRFPGFVDAAEPSTKAPTTVVPTGPPSTAAPMITKLSNAVNLHPALALVAAALLALL